MYPWTGYDNRLSVLKLSVFVLLFMPALWIAVAHALDRLGARPLNEAIHQSGLWMIRLLFLSLAITPLRQVLHLPRLIEVRRMVGVAAFAYGAAHLLLYAADEMFVLSKIATEIIVRVYLAIGFVALIGLAALAATSTDGMVRRLGRRWQWLHRTIYIIGILATIHFFMQSKADVHEPIVMAGLLAWLMGYRALAWIAPRLPLARLAALGIAAAALTGLGEAGYFWIKMGVDPVRVLDANLTTATGTRPGWIVLGIAAAIAIGGILRTSAQRRPRTDSGRAAATGRAAG